MVKNKLYKNKKQNSCLFELDTTKYEQIFSDIFLSFAYHPDITTLVDIA